MLAIVNASKMAIRVIAFDKFDEGEVSNIHKMLHIAALYKLFDSALY